MKCKNLPFTNFLAGKVFLIKQSSIHFSYFLLGERKYLTIYFQASCTQLCNNQLNIHIMQTKVSFRKNVKWGKNIQKQRRRHVNCYHVSNGHKTNKYISDFSWMRFSAFMCYLFKRKLASNTSFKASTILVHVVQPSLQQNTQPQKVVI